MEVDSGDRVAIDAGLFFATGKDSKNMTATIYDDWDLQSESNRFGFVDGDPASQRPASDD